MLFVWIGKTHNQLIFLWVVLSLIMLIIPSYFYVNDFIVHPQHGLFEYFDQVSEKIQNGDNINAKWWYRLFFLIDFIWALLTLTLIALQLNKQEGRSVFDFSEIKLDLKLFLVVATVAYTSDFIEGVLYLSYCDWYLEPIVQIKTGAYLLCVCFYLYWLLRNVVIGKVRSFVRFFGTSILSIFFIAVIYLLITMMEQGGTLMVHLFFSPGNVLIFFFLLLFLAILVSHYPVYFDIWINDKEGKIIIEKAKSLDFFGINVIYYDTSKLPPNYSFSNNVVKGLRRSMGVLLYVAVFNIMLGLVNRYFEVKINSLSLTLFILAISLFIYYLEGKTYGVWMSTLRNPNAIDKRVNTMIKDVVNYVGAFPWFFVIYILLVVVLTILISNLGWHWISVIAFMVVLTLQLFLYVMFKISRSLLKYVFLNERLISQKGEIFDDLILKRFRSYYKLNPAPRYAFFNLFAHLSNNISYLRVMQFSGIVSLLVICTANFYFRFATWFNPIVIILFYIILVYSIIVLVFKQILYQSQAESGIMNGLVRYGIPLGLTLLVAFTMYFSKLPNDLHEIQLVDRNELISYKKYLSEKTNSYDSKKNYFFVGSYGGGLKANLWNLLLLNEIQKTHGDKFLDRTLVLSGVSGGAVGIGNYTALVANQESDFDSTIFQIGKSNVLSNELVYLVGKDWVREYLPFVKHKGMDRSYMSMKEHARLTKTSAGDYDKVGFEDFWYRAYSQTDADYPLVILNSTAVGGQQGVTTSVEFPENTFAGARVMNQFDGVDNNLTLPFFGAVSTTNRFPIFSPTAKIKDKGAFLDGGYFENSGLLSARQAWEIIEKENSLNFESRIQPIFINIINSKDFYIQEKMKQFGIEPTFQNDPGEYLSILETVGSTDKMPNYVLKNIENEGYFVLKIMMPHKISYDDIQRFVRGDVENPLALMDSLNQHNKLIDKALKDYEAYEKGGWGVVEPPLARLLSLPAVRYQEAMVKHHDSIKWKIQNVLGKFLETEEMVTPAFRKKL